MAGRSVGRGFGGAGESGGAGGLDGAGESGGAVGLDGVGVASAAGAGATSGSSVVSSFGSGWGLNALNRFMVGSRGNRHHRAAGLALVAQQIMQADIAEQFVHGLLHRLPHRTDGAIDGMRAQFFLAGMTV